MKVVRAGPMPMLGTTATPMRKDTAATAPHARRVTRGLLLPREGQLAWKIAAVAADPVAVEAILVGCAELLPEMRSKLAELTEWMKRVESVLCIHSGIDEEAIEYELWLELDAIVEKETGRDEANEVLEEMAYLLDIWHR